MIQQLMPPTVKGIGIDAVEVARFARWHTYSDKKLSRIFSQEEIAYCKACTTKSSERFAARFAAREALYKALCQAYPTQQWNFLALCKAVTINKGPQGQPLLSFLPQIINDQHSLLLSLSHTHDIAFAWVLIQ